MAEVESQDPTQGGGAPPQKDPLLGRVLNGRFNILEPIGSGGMGRVYKAMQAPLDRLVAVKVLHPQFSSHDTGFVRRFVLEASLTSKLRHPNTVTVIDHGQTEDNIFYIAMEYLEGRTVAEVLAREGPLPWQRALHIGQQVCRSLREAHKFGIIHRDLKPANVMLLDEADNDQIKVLDFGLVKPIVADPRAPENDPKITQAGMLLGSPQYMAPEQARSISDARSDVYSFGVVLYEMLVGRPPFVAKDYLEVILKHMREAPPPFRAQRPDIPVPPHVEGLVMRCLQKDPATRFQSMDEVLEAMRAIAGVQVNHSGLHAPVTGTWPAATATPPPQPMRGAQPGAAGNPAATSASRAGQPTPAPMRTVSGSYPATAAQGQAGAQPPQGGNPQQRPPSGAYPQPPQGAYSQRPPSGAYPQPPQGAYSQRPPSGAYPQPPQGAYSQRSPSGAYPQPSPSGNYPQPSQSGTYPQPSQSGHYPQPSQSGHYPQPSQSGHYPQPPQSGPYPQPSQSGNYPQPAMGHVSTQIMGTPSAVGPGEPALFASSAPSGGSKGLWVALGLVALLGGGGGVYWFALRAKPAPATAPEASAQPETKPPPTPAPVVAAPAQPVQAATSGKPVRFRVNSEPSGARVFMGARDLGATPLTFEMPPQADGTATAELVFILDGYHPLSATAGGSGDVVLSQRLQKKSGRSSSSSETIRVASGSSGRQVVSAGADDKIEAPTMVAPEKGPDKKSEGAVLPAAVAAAGGSPSAPAHAGGGVMAFSEGMSRPEQLQGAPIFLPREAIAAKVEGLMIVKCVINPTGHLENCRALKKLPYVEDAVIQSLYKRVYKPVQFQGHPVAVEYVFDVKVAQPR